MALLKSPTHRKRHALTGRERRKGALLKGKRRTNACRPCHICSRRLPPAAPTALGRPDPFASSAPGGRGGSDSGGGGGSGGGGRDDGDDPLRQALAKARAYLAPAPPGISSPSPALHSYGVTHSGSGGLALREAAPAGRGEGASQNVLDVVKESLAPMLATAAKENDALREQLGVAQTHKDELADKLLESRKCVCVCVCA